ncbi:MAG: type II toxin-antitoxin system PemK/MazF family toxin [Verrucomicrobiota bacterium]
MKRFEVWRVRLDPTTGSEMQKTRPCLVVSPNGMSARLRTVIVAPLTEGGFSAPFRVPCQFESVAGQIALDHLRAVDKARLLHVLGTLDSATQSDVLARLAEMFKE